MEFKDNIEADLGYNKNHGNRDEIDLLELFLSIWKNRRTILYSILLFILVGLIVAFGSKVEYTAECKIIPESQEGTSPNFGGLGNLAAFAGVNLNLKGNAALPAEIYPEIVGSIPFKWSVLQRPVHFGTTDTIITPYVFFHDVDKPSFLKRLFKYTFGLPYEIKSWFSKEENEFRSQVDSGNEIIKISIEDDRLLEDFSERIRVEVDSKSGIIKISVLMPDADAAAEVANNALHLLTDYLIEYKISKVRQNLKFIRERYKEAKSKFEKAQKDLALFNDRNQNVVTALAQTERQGLTNEYNLAFEVYKNLATQLEEAEIKVKEETPVFTVLEPVKLPVKKSSPKRAIILITSVILGTFFGIVWILLRRVFNQLKLNKDI